MKNASIHRFHDFVALAFPGEGETVYLSASEARSIAKALCDAARNVERVPFIASEFGCVEVSSATNFKGPYA